MIKKAFCSPSKEKIGKADFKLWQAQWHHTTHLLNEEVLNYRLACALLTLN